MDCEIDPRFRSSTVGKAWIAKSLINKSKIDVTDEGCFGWRGTIRGVARRFLARQSMQPPGELDRFAPAASARRRRYVLRGCTAGVRLAGRLLIGSLLCGEAAPEAVECFQPAVLELIAGQNTTLCVPKLTGKYQRPGPARNNCVSGRDSPARFRSRNATTKLCGHDRPHDVSGCSHAGTACQGSSSKTRTILPLPQRGQHRIESSVTGWSGRGQASAGGSTSAIDEASRVRHFASRALR